MNQTIRICVLICLLLSETISSNAQTNVAMGKIAYSSSNENAGLPPGNAIDGNLGTRWSSGFLDNQWIYVDLGQKYNLAEVRLHWENAYGTAFNVEVSNDAVTWLLVEDVTGNSLLNNTIDASAYTARYVRMFGVTRATQYGFSLFEMEVFGLPADNTPLVNLALLKPAASSSIENGQETPDHAFDGFGTNVINGKALDGGGVEYNRWASAASDPQWISVDLGAVYDIREVLLYWESANGRDFDIEVSDDNVTWTLAASVRNNGINQYINDIPIPDVITGRYVRMNGLLRNTEYGYSLYEFQVLGPNVILPILLSDFKAVKSGSAANITWKAILDLASVFDIERSNGNNAFEKIGTIRRGAGTVGATEDFAFTDASPLPGINHYRLKYTEANGRSLYSDIKAVNFGSQRNAVLYPNPVLSSTGQFYVLLSEPVKGNVETRVIDAGGKVKNISRNTLNNENLLQPKLLGYMAPGYYYVQLWHKGKILLNKAVIFK